MGSVTPLATRAHSGLTTLPRCEAVPRYVTDEMMRRACLAWLRGNKLAHICDILGVAESIGRRMVESHQWKRACDMFREEVRDENIVTTQALASIALEKVRERLEQGDVHLTKDGVRVTVPVKAIDAASIADRMLGHYERLTRTKDGLPATETDETLAKLLSVAAILQSAGHPYVPPAAPVKDVTPIDADSVEISSDDLPQPLSNSHAPA